MLIPKYIDMVATAHVTPGAYLFLNIEPSVTVILHGDYLIKYSITVGEVHRNVKLNLLALFSDNCR